jgi:hypothetical protein
VAVLATMGLNCVVLVWGGEEDWTSVALLTFVAHMPIAVIEAVVLGFTVGFLAKVKPEMLGWAPPLSPLIGPMGPIGPIGPTNGEGSKRPLDGWAAAGDCNGVTAAPERPHPAAPPTGPGPH